MVEPWPIEIDSAGLPNLKMVIVIFHGKLLNNLDGNPYS
jgi:hypothetical protein